MSSTKLRLLTAAQVEYLYKRMIANSRPSQPSVLESAVASPMNANHYNQENNVFYLAAILSERIMRNHSYNDGNKRAGLVAADMFLKINGYQLQANQGLTEAQVAVVTSQWDAEELGRYYQDIANPRICDADYSVFRNQS